MDDEKITISQDETIGWEDVENLGINYLGLYRLKFKDGFTIYFPPSDLPVMVLGRRLNEDQMSRLIEAKRKKYRFKN